LPTHVLDFTCRLRTSENAAQKNGETFLAKLRTDWVVTSRRGIEK